MKPTTTKTTLQNGFEISRALSRESDRTSVTLRTAMDICLRKVGTGTPEERKMATSILRKLDKCWRSFTDESKLGRDVLCIRLAKAERGRNEKAKENTVLNARLSSQQKELKDLRWLRSEIDRVVLAATQRQLLHPPFTHCDDDDCHIRFLRG